MRVEYLDLADSALHAPMAGFADQDLYPDFVDKAAVLLVRLAKNHPLPDGNKRTAWVCLRLFAEVNGWALHPYPSVDEAEAAVLAVAAGEWSEEDAKRCCCHSSFAERVLTPKGTGDRHRAAQKEHLRSTREGYDRLAMMCARQRPALSGHRP